MTARLWRLKNPIRHYPWGSRTAIPALLGEENPRREPWAEMWIGAHPTAPSTVVEDGDERPLPELLAEGAGAARPGAAPGGAAELPFMVKILAAAEPLSIQCHPDADRARAGFAREEARGVARDAPERSYRDEGGKPELLVAQSPFVALAGFREPAEIAENFARLALEELAPERAEIERDGDLHQFFDRLMTMPAPRRARAIAEAARKASRSSRPEAARVADLAARYPADPGALAPLYLHLVELEPGEGLFLPPRSLHTYLEGMGIEVMASSDNVLRGGLTKKHVDLSELFSVVDFAPAPPRRLRPEPAGEPGVARYPTATDEFEVARVDAAAGVSREVDLAGSPALALCAAGGVTIREGAEGGAVSLDRGGAVFMSAEAGSAVVEGEGTAYVTHAPMAARPRTG